MVKSTYLHYLSPEKVEDIPRKRVSSSNVKCVIYILAEVIFVTGQKIKSCWGRNHECFRLPSSPSEGSFLAAMTPNSLIRKQMVDI